MADKEVSQKNKVSVPAPAVTATVTHGAGPAGTVAVSTTTLVKATAITPVAVIASSVHNGGAVAVPATAGAFDRSVVTSLGK